jgi:thioredoxin reductase
MKSITDHNALDVLIVGAGPAGLNASLVLGRMRRHVLLLDTESPAHAVAAEVHGFLGQDGTPPSDLRRLGRDQLKPYITVELRKVAARAARRLTDGGFELTLDDGSSVTGRRLLLADGMRYGLPDLPGLADLWGRKVFHCPYCHGWEVRDQRLGVYGGGERAVHQALLLLSLSDDVVVFPASATVFTVEQLRSLVAAGIDVRTDHVEHVEQLQGDVRLVMQGGAVVERDALFIQPRLSLASGLASSLGAELTDSGSVAVDATGQSGVGGLYVAGDASSPVQSVAVATGGGARAAYAINASLLTEVAVHPPSLPTSEVCLANAARRHAQPPVHSRRTSRFAASAPCPPA